MRIDPDIEKPTRDLLGHAIRGELDEMTQLVYSIGDQRYAQCTALSIAVVGYIAIDASGMRWPSDAALGEMARHAAETTTAFDLSETQIAEFLSRVVFGNDKLDDVFPELAVSTTLPILATARVIVSHRPHRARDKNWWDYLEVIERALEAASPVDLSLLPALMLRAHRETAQG
jgi:hypothetical protein